MQGKAAMHVRWRGLELPSLVNCDAATLTNTYGKFVAEPFERGLSVGLSQSKYGKPSGD